MAYANLSTGYHELKVYSIVCQRDISVSKYFENPMFRFLHECQLLLKVDMVKPDRFISILNQINNNIQLTVEESQTRLQFLVLMISKTGTESKVDIYNKPT